MDSLYIYTVRISLSFPLQDQTNVGVGIDKPPNQSTQSDSHPNGSQQSPCRSPAFNEKKEKYQTFSFSDQEGETDVDEQIQLIESERGFGDRVTAVEETSRDSDLQSKAENVCIHHKDYFSLIIIKLCTQCFCSEYYIKVGLHKISIFYMYTYLQNFCFPVWNKPDMLQVRGGHYI